MTNQEARALYQQGQEVTVTDPSMTRYFMTIPEAGQLILPVGAMGKRDTLRDEILRAACSEVLPSETIFEAGTPLRR